MKVIGNALAIYCFKPQMEAVERVNAGGILKVRTSDCFSGQITREDQFLSDADFSRINPATGPVYVEGAEPGDLLKIKILSIDVAPHGLALVVPKEGALGAQVTRSLTRVLPIRDGCCHFKGMAIPIRPMIGVIGVAPSIENGPYSTGVACKYGGNMDTADICEGSTVYLPVSQEGALLAMGDCHAVMGDGEVCFTGCEVAAEVTVQIDVVKGRATEWPLVETGQSTMVIASRDTLDEAMVEATSNAVTLLAGALGLSWEDAYILASLVVDLKISQVVDPKKTVRAAIPKSIAPTEALIRSVGHA